METQLSDFDPKQSGSFWDAQISNLRESTLVNCGNSCHGPSTPTAALPVPIGIDEPELPMHARERSQSSVILKEDEAWAELESAARAVVRCADMLTASSPKKRDKNANNGATSALKKALDAIILLGQESTISRAQTAINACGCCDALRKLLGYTHTFSGALDCLVGT